MEKSLKEGVVGNQVVRSHRKNGAHFMDTIAVYPVKQQGTIVEWIVHHQETLDLYELCRRCCFLQMLLTLDPFLSHRMFRTL